MLSVQHLPQPIKQLEPKGPITCQHLDRKIAILQQELFSLHRKSIHSLNSPYCFFQIHNATEIRELFEEIQNLKKAKKVLKSQESQVFNDVGIDPTYKIPSYSLKKEKLSPKQAHMFFSLDQGAEFLIASELEYSTFHPTEKERNALFKFRSIKEIGEKTIWCSFPIKYQKKCETIAKIYGFTRQPGAKNLFVKEGEERKVLKFPSEDNLLFFKGDRTRMNPALITILHAQIREAYAKK